MRMEYGRSWDFDAVLPSSANTGFNSPKNQGDKMKRIKRAITIIIIMVFLSSCGYRGITGVVVESKTGKPVEGAVVLVEWTKTKGLPGLTYGETHKTVEAITGNDGAFRIPGVIDPFVNPPIVVVYKNGYVAWSSGYIFPSWEKRSKFEYKNGLMIELDHFKKEYSHADHVLFLSSAAISGSGGRILDAAYLWERELARKK
jgi:hypothetical protein